MLVSGAKFSVLSTEADNVASRLYENIRHRSMDCYKISKSTPFSIDQIQVIKNYIFCDSHYILNNDKYEFRRFHPSYDIAESWIRLASNKKQQNIMQHDMILLYHELSEIMILLQHPEYTQNFAHTLANKKYDYQSASDSYYKSIGRL